MTVQYFLPMSIISVAYARIAFRLWGSKTPGAAQTDRDHNILLNKKKVSGFWFLTKKKKINSKFLVFVLPQIDTKNEKP